MPFVPFPAGVMAAVIRFYLDGIPAVITQGYKLRAGSASPSDGGILAAAIYAWLGSDLMPLLAPQAVSPGLDVYDMTSAGGWVYHSIGTQGGTASGTAVPNNVCMTVTFNTALRGRSNRGRNFIPGLPTGDQLNQYQWATSATNAMTTAFNHLEAAINGINMDQVVLSRQTGGVVRTLGEANLVTSFRANQPIFTQRGRLT